jgi:hypothetical protein
MGKITPTLAQQRASVPEELKRLLGPMPGNVAFQPQSPQPHTGPPTISAGV